MRWVAFDTFRFSQEETPSSSLLPSRAVASRTVGYSLRLGTSNNGKWLATI